MSEKKALEYTLLNMLTTKYEFVLSKENLDTPDAIDYNIDPKVGFNVKDSLVFVTVTITASSKATRDKVMLIETIFTFSIKDLESFLEKDPRTDNKSWKFKDNKDEGILLTFISIAYSTMRGIVLEKSKGTILERHFLPIVDPRIFIKKQEV